MLDDEIAAFLEEGLAIHIGTRTADLEPNGTRLTAVKVEDDRTHLVAYAPKPLPPDILADLESNGQVALCFVRPPDDRACQVKGVFAGVRPATPRERGFVMAQWDAFRRNLDAIGVPGVAIDRWRAWPCLAIRLRVTDLFNQTPGPGAGASLR